MITEQQATTVIALLTEIRDELARPRLEVERHNKQSRADIATMLGRTVPVPTAPATPPTLWAGGAAGLAVTRQGDPP